MPKKQEQSAPATDDQLGIVPKLILLCYEDDISGVIRCLADGANICDTTCLTNGFNEMITGVTALYVAAQRGNYALCKVLLFCGADVHAKTHNVANGQEFTPADVALFNMHLRTWWLLKHYTKKANRSHSIQAWEKLLNELQVKSDLQDVDHARAWRLGQEHQASSEAGSVQGSAPSGSSAAASISMGLSSVYSGTGLEPDMAMMVNADLAASAHVMAVPPSAAAAAAHVVVTAPSVRSSAALNFQSYHSEVSPLGAFLSRPTSPTSPTSPSMQSPQLSPSSNVRIMPASPVATAKMDLLTVSPSVAEDIVVSVLGSPLPNARNHPTPSVVLVSSKAPN